MLRELEILVSFLSFRLAGCGASQEWVQASRIPSARGESVAASTGDRYPNRETFFGCCASAMIATASTAPANRIDASAAFLNRRLISGVIYHTDGSRGRVIYEHHSVAVSECPSLVSDENTRRPTHRPEGDRDEGATLRTAFFAYKNKKASLYLSGL